MSRTLLPEPETFQTRGGRTIWIRPIRPDDGERLIALHNSLSTETIRYRFLSIHKVLSSQEAFDLTHLDYNRQMAFVAAIPDPDQRLVGVARYDSTRMINPGDA